MIDRFCAFCSLARSKIECCYSFDFNAYLFGESMGFKSQFLGWLIVDFISMGEKCLYCRCAFSAASSETSHSMKRLFWLWKKVRYSILKYLYRSRKDEGNLWKTFLVFQLSEITVLRRAVCFRWTRALLCLNMNEYGRHILSIIRKLRNGKCCPNFQSRDEWIGSRWTLLVYQRKKNNAIENRK